MGAVREAASLQGADLSVAELTRRNLQRLLSDTVQRLRRTTQARSVVAWALQADAQPYVAAADFSGEPPVAPSRALFGAIAALPGATHLRDPHADDAFVALARKTRAEAAVPIVASGTPALAALLLDGDVAPATLAALDSAALQLATPLATALFLGRLAALDGAVRELDRLASLGALATELAKQMRGPLQSLANFVEVLPEHREEPEFLNRYRDVVRGELQRIDRMLDLVTEHGEPRLEPGETELAPVLDRVSELLRLRAGAREIEIALRGSGPGCRLRLAEGALRQLLFNLIHHVVEAATAGTRVEIEVRTRPRDAEIEIRGTGREIPVELRERVFEPFFVAEEGDPPGLGLAIARRIAEGAGGDLSITAAPGAYFRLRLPRVLRVALSGDAARPADMLP